MYYPTKEVIDRIHDIEFVQDYMKNLFALHFNPWTIKKFHTEPEVMEDGLTSAVLASNGLTYLIHIVNGMPTIASINGKPDDEYYFTRKELEDLLP